MDISALIQLAVAGTDPERLEIGDLEPVELKAEAVGGLAAIVSELAHNAIDLSGEHDKVGVTGSVDPDGYLIEVADDGLGVSDQFLDGLNRVLDDPGGLVNQSESASGMFLVAGLAARHGFKVRLSHGTPGMTARVSIPSRLIDGPPMPVPEAPSPPASASNGVGESVNGHHPAGSEAEKMETEAFLERVFAPLLEGETSRPPKPNGGEAGPTPESVSPEVPEPEEPSGTSSLRTRVPGENYDEPAEDASHTKAGEAAVEIKLALSDYDRGRQAAVEGNE